MPEVHNNYASYLLVTGDDKFIIVRLHCNLKVKEVFLLDQWKARCMIYPLKAYRLREMYGQFMRKE
ncbi:MAG: hypothetical protein K6T34_09360 [Thermoflavifilum sp.]|nr:hypothetical protein [Thermoflavifilum sp.]